MSNLALAPPGDASGRRDETNRHLLSALLALFFSVFLICADLLQFAIDAVQRASQAGGSTATRVRIAAA